MTMNSCTPSTTNRLPSLSLVALLLSSCTVVNGFTANPHWHSTVAPSASSSSSSSPHSLSSIVASRGALWSLASSRKSDGDKGKKKPSASSSSSSSSSSTEKNGGGSTGRFAKGDELKRLRSDLASLRENLQWAQAMEDHDRVADLNKAIQNGENRDPDLVYQKALRGVIDAKASFKLSEDEKKRRVAKWKREAAEARRLLPRFQMEGLWVGNYGEHGLELINVTYTGDTMVATKVTGDVNVPRGQTSFTADLSPTNASSLEPLKVSFDREATQLLRYPGKGQIAKRDFTDKKFVEGQIVMFDQHFSFVWIPTRHHVLFRRPTPEQTISLLRDVISREDEIQNMRDHLSRCFDMDMTESLARFHANQGQEPFRRIKLGVELQELENEKNMMLPATNEKTNPFWQLHKWKSYIDRVLGDVKEED